MFDDPEAAAREAFQTAAAIIALGDEAATNLTQFADYPGWTADQTRAPSQARAPCSASVGATRCARSSRRVTAVRSRPICVSAGHPPDVRAVRRRRRRRAARRGQRDRRDRDPHRAGQQHNNSKPAAATSRHTRQCRSDARAGAPTPPLERRLTISSVLSAFEDAKREINQQEELIRIAQMRERRPLAQPHGQ